MSVCSMNHRGGPGAGCGRLPPPACCDPAVILQADPQCGMHREGPGSHCARLKPGMDSSDKVSKQDGWQLDLGSAPALGNTDRDFQAGWMLLAGWSWRPRCSPWVVLPSPVPQPFAATVSAARRVGWCSPSSEAPSAKSYTSQIPRRRWVPFAARVLVPLSRI